MVIPVYNKLGYDLIVQGDVSPPIARQLSLDLLKGGFGANPQNIEKIGKNEIKITYLPVELVVQFVEADKFSYIFKQ